MTRSWRGGICAGSFMPLVGGLLIGLLCGMPSTMQGQRTHLLVVAGLSGAPEFRARFDSAARALGTAATQRWGVRDSSLIVLGEDSVRTAGYTGRSTREQVGYAFVQLSRQVQPGDLLLVVLMGHGSGEGAQSKVNLPGPDATAQEYAAWLAPFARQQVVFVNAATGSGDFVPVLVGAGRVVVSATRTAMERNDSEFLQRFTEAVVSDAADADKDGRVSVLEAFRLARTEVARSYERSNRLLTEHAVLSDSVVAGRITLGRQATAPNAAVAALMAERQALESRVAALRTQKASMDAATYAAELERLLLAIAEKTAAIKAAGGGR